MKQITLPSPRGTIRCPAVACRGGGNRNRVVFVRAEAHPVKLTFKLTRQMPYGMHLVMTGGCEAMGNWDPKKGLKLTWSDGHVWTATTDLPSGVKTEYKYVTRSKTGEIGEWQGGANMFIVPPEQAAACNVKDSWEGASIVTMTSKWTPPPPPPPSILTRTLGPAVVDPLEALAAAAYSLPDQPPEPIQPPQPPPPAQEPPPPSPAPLAQPQAPPAPPTSSLPDIILPQAAVTAAAAAVAAAAPGSNGHGSASGKPKETAADAAAKDGSATYSQDDLMSRFKNEWLNLNKGGTSTSPDQAPPSSSQYTSDYDLGGIPPSGNGHARLGFSERLVQRSDTHAPPPIEAVSSLHSMDMMHSPQDDESVSAGEGYPPDAVNGAMTSPSPYMGGGNSITPFSTWDEYASSMGTWEGVVEVKPEGMASNGSGPVDPVEGNGAGGDNREEVPGGGGGLLTVVGSALLSDGGEVVFETGGRLGAVGSWDGPYEPSVMVVRTPRMRRVVLNPDGHAQSRLGVLTVSELRFELRRRGLACHGNHRDLVQRLIEAGMEW